MPFSKPRTANSKLTLGFSPCPNDTFMFDAMVNGKIDTEDLQFQIFMEDVEMLNQKALHDELDISKISFAAFTKVTDQYQLLNSGSALGIGVGPLVISDFGFQISDLKNKNLKIAVPGMNTTANFLFTIFFPQAENKVEMIFSEIENAVLSRKVDAGVIIHENRFTYEQKGLKNICDLGELWERKTGQPIPLGGIAVRKIFPEELKQKIDRVMKRSVEYAFANPQSSLEYVKQHAQEMNEDVRRKHIETYVNDFSADLGEEGRNAVHVLFQKAMEVGMIKSIPERIFVEPDRKHDFFASLNRTSSW